MSEKAPTVEVEKNNPSPYEDLSRESLKAIVEAKASIDKDSDTPYADLRTNLREALEASGDSKAFRRIHNMGNLELDAFVENAGIESKNRYIGDLKALVDAYDNNESFGDRRSAIREALEAAGETNAFRKVHDMSNPELTMFINDARQKLQEETRLDKDEALENAYTEYEEREGTPYDVNKGRIKDPETARVHASMEDISRTIEQDPEAAGKLGGKLDELRTTLAGDEEESNPKGRERIADTLDDEPENSKERTRIIDTLDDEDKSRERIQDTLDDDEDDDEEPSPERRTNRINTWLGTAINRARIALDDFGQYLRGLSTNPERRVARRVAIGVLGAAAVAGVAIAWKAGAFDNLFGNGANTGGGTQAAMDNAQHPTTIPPFHDHETYLPNGGSASQEMLPDPSNTVHSGEGWNEVMANNNIDPSNFHSRLTEIGPDLAKKGWAYFDNNHGEWRISHTGQLSQDVLDLIKNGK